MKSTKKFSFLVNVYYTALKLMFLYANVFIMNRTHLQYQKVKKWFKPHVEHNSFLTVLIIPTDSFKTANIYHPSAPIHLSFLSPS